MVPVGGVTGQETTPEGIAAIDVINCIIKAGLIK